jgi:hypothetical protein
VRIVSPDWRAVFGGLSTWAASVLDNEPAALGVLLYGSLARGDHAPGSDADVLVVLRESPKPPSERAGALPPLRLPICHEILVYTRAELARLTAEGLPFLRRALAEGKWLARRADWSPPPMA